MSVVKEETTILEEVLGILEDFMDLTAYDLPNDFPLMQDKRRKVKVFNVGDDMMVFLCKEKPPIGNYNKFPRMYDSFKVIRKMNDNAYVVALPYSMSIFNTFSVANIHKYQGSETLYREDNSTLSYSEVEDTDVGRLVARIKEEVAR